MLIKSSRYCILFISKFATNIVNLEIKLKQFKRGEISIPLKLFDILNSKKINFGKIYELNFVHLERLTWTWHAS